MRRTRRLDARRCAAGHVSMHRDELCSQCGRVMRTISIGSEAVLELVTTVRVNPAGEAFQLGVAVTRAGRVRTLCRVEGTMRGHGNDAVILERRGDTIVARPRRVVRARSRVRSANRRGARRY
jgi:uncharacterized OB-fold protein